MGRTRGVALAFVTAVISGVAVFVNGYGVKHFDDATVYTTAKNAVAAGVLAVLALASRPRREARASAKDRWALVAIGAVGGSVPFVLFFEGLARASAPSAAFIHKTLVVWVAMLALPLLGERLGPLHVAAIALLIAGQGLLAGDLRALDAGGGEAMILAATLLWAVEIVIAKRVLPSVDALTVGTARMGVGLLLLLGYAAATGRITGLVALGASEWMWAAATGVLLAGYVGTWYAALRLAQAVDVTAVLVFGAVVTAALSAGVSGSPLRPSLAGLIVVTAGCALAGIAARRQPVRA